MCISLSGIRAMGVNFQYIHFNSEILSFRVKEWKEQNNQVWNLPTAAGAAAAFHMKFETP